MKEFNLEEYLKNPSQKVVTRDGSQVRIICTDARNNFPIVGLIYVKEPEEKELLVNFQKNGKYLFTENSTFDLFFAPIKREGWINLYKDKDEDITYLPGIIHDSEEEAKRAIKDDPDFIATIKIEWEE